MRTDSNSSTPTVTQSLRYASGTWTMTEEIEKKLQTTQRRMMRMIIQTKRKTGKRHAAPHAVNVGDTADVGPHDPDRLSTTTKTSTSTKKAGTDADSNPCFDEISEENPEDELESSVDYVMRPTHIAGDLLAASGIVSWIVRQSRIHWKQAKMIDKHHQDRWTKFVSNWNQVISNQARSVLETRKTGQVTGKTTSTSTYDQIEPTGTTMTSGVTHLAHRGGRQLEMG